MIHLTDIQKKFGKLTVLDHLDLSIQDGGIFAILGPNGSGKTTLIKSLLGMVIPDGGEISINGKSVLGEWQYREQISYLPQIATFPENLTVKELISMVKNLRSGSADEKELIQLFDLEPFLKKRLAHLSGGTKQKVNLLLTFMFDSELIILDEPTTGLDPLSAIHLKELIQREKAKDKTILVTTHVMSFVDEIADEIVFLLDGKIYFKGTVDQLKKQTDETDLEHAIASLMTKQTDANV